MIYLFFVTTLSTLLTTFNFWNRTITYIGTAYGLHS